MTDFKNKIVVITGGAQGIGRCIFEDFRKQGAVVAIIDAQELPKDVAPNLYYKGDIGDKEVLDDFADTVIEKFGRVDILVNNAPPLFKTKKNRYRRMTQNQSPLAAGERKISTSPVPCQ